MTGSHTHPRVNCRLLPARKTAGRLQDRRSKHGTGSGRTPSWNGTGATSGPVGPEPAITGGRARPGAAVTLPVWLRAQVAVRPGTPGRLGEAVKDPFAPTGNGPAAIPRFRGRRHRYEISITSGVRLAGDALTCPDDDRFAAKHRGDPRYADGGPGPAVSKLEGGGRSAPGATPAIADNGRTNPVTAVNGPVRGTRRPPGEGVPGQ